MEKHLSDISREDFNWLTGSYGKDGGYSHIDSKEGVIHEIFKDKILIGTDFLNCASYELSFPQGELHIRKSRLDNYKLHEKAVLIADEMLEEDNEELGQRWHALLRELKLLEKLSQLDNTHEQLAQLYLDIFEEEEAEEQIANLPDVVPPNVMAIWDELQVALQQTGNLAEFEWKELSDEGIYALNQLAPVVAAGATIEAPDDIEYENIIAADDFAKAWLDYVNVQLEDVELKIVAIGPVLDEYQSFSCFPMQDFRLANALLKMEELGLVCFF
ncbi:DUF6630 family protein [Chitinophaga solisilvae]|uniref:DUF6630 domain-containing protein n=1 Tax=Chitinophaga solisilvae TaxID=1233460 RepID=A0A433WNA8_9BACT|nr:hypothetical protein [Chitinophaga solisilvae]NSL86615.1 hypothetical protein [Chitinophaga solisilvae]